MNKFAKKLRILIVVNFLFYSYSANAETWCGFAAPSLPFTFSSCAPSPEILSKPFCTAWANNEAGSYYNLTSNSVVVSANPYLPEPPPAASVYQFACAATGTPIDATDPQGLGPLNSFFNGFNAHLAPKDAYLFFIESKSAEYKGCSDPSSNDSVRISTGENVYSEVDFKTNSPSKIDFIRYYGSFDNRSSTIGKGWSHNYDKNITFETDSLGVMVAKVNRVRGRFNYFTKTGTNTWRADNDVLLRLKSLPDQYELSLPDDSREIYNLNGQLITIVYLNSYKIVLGYDSNGLLTSITDSLNYSLTLSYTLNNKLSLVKTSDGRQFVYQYNQELLNNIIAMDGVTNFYSYDDINNPSLLTGLADQFGSRSLTWNYDNLKRVISTERLAINGIEKLTYDYSSNINSSEIYRSVTSSRSRSLYTFNLVLGVPLLTTVDGDGYTECDKGYPSYSYDHVNGNIRTKTKYNITTQYSNYDEKHNAKIITEGFGKPESKTTLLSYNPNFYRKVATKSEDSVSALSGKKITNYSYDVYGNITNITIDGFTYLGFPVSRTISYEYNGPLNQLSLIDGPRENTSEVNDIKRFDYYTNTVTSGFNRARLRSVNHSGIIVRSDIQYTASGKISSETRTNNLVISNEYHSGNDRLRRYTEIVGNESRSVTYNYFDTGELSSLLFTGSNSYADIRFDYYLNNQFMGMQDSLYNSIFTERDNENNLTRSEVFSLANNGTQNSFQAIEQTFSLINGRLESVSTGKESSNFSLDNRMLDFVTSKGGFSSNSRIGIYYGFDGIGRLTRLDVNAGFSSVIQPKLTEYKYGINDMLAALIEPNSVITEYFYDDLGNLLAKGNGLNAFNRFEYDDAGNVIKQDSVNFNSTMYSYDNVNRVTSIKGNNIVGNITASYDNCLGGVGRLCRVEDESGITKYEYDGFGRIIRQTNIDRGVNYETYYNYDTLDRLISTQYPSGRTITNFYQKSGQIKSVDTVMNAQSSVVIDNANYTADGKIHSFVYGNGYSENRIYNVEGHLQSQSMPKKFVDVIAPVITPPENITLEATAILTPVSIGLATAVDNVDGTVIAMANNTGPFPLGVTTVTWSAIDATGNKATATQTITVTDLTAPVISAPVNLWLVSDVALVVALGNATATDIFSPLVVTNDAPATFPIGITTVIWTATDANGNSSIASQTVTITTVEAANTDLILPVVTAPANITMEASAENTPVTLGEATAIDNVDGYIPATPDQSGTFEIGRYDILWTAVDSNGNHGTALQVVVVQDTTPPVITAPNDITVISDIPVEINIGLATASDIFLDDVINDAPDPFPVGTTLVTWTATDINNNVATATQVVTVTPVALNNTASFKTVSLSYKQDTSTTLTDTTFDISSEHQSVVLISMVSNKIGETLPAKIWYRASKYGRWTILNVSQVSNLVPDVTIIVTDSQIDLWQLDTKSNKIFYKKHKFDGKAWSLSQAMTKITHNAWLPSQPDAALRPEVTWQYQYDDRGNMKSRSGGEYELIFNYDEFGRLTNDIVNGKFYQYDSNDNIIFYSDKFIYLNLNYLPGTNFLISNGPINIEVDNNGNIINDGKHSYVYNEHDRLVTVDSNILYSYNAFGQRKRKTTPSGSTVYHYNLAGQLISETDAAGKLLKEYVYLNNLPVAVYSVDVSGETTVAYVHTDNLFTARRVTNAKGKVIWSWDSDAFGQTAANEDPDGDGISYEMNLRFYQQYFDKESGLHNSNDKYYDPSIGRYITNTYKNIDNEMNTFAFLSGNPLKRPDIYCIRNQHLNRNFDIYNKAINTIYKPMEINVTGFKDFLKEGTTNSLTTIFNEPNQNCNKITNDLGRLLKSKNIRNSIKTKVLGIGYMENKKSIFEIQEP